MLTGVQLVIAAFCYLGVIAGAILPFHRKKDITKWDRQYTYVVIVACVLSMITLETSIIGYAESITRYEGFLLPVFTAFVTGFGFHSVTAEALKVLRLRKMQ